MAGWLAAWRQPAGRQAGTASSVGAAQPRCELPPAAGTFQLQGHAPGCVRGAQCPQSAAPPPRPRWRPHQQTFCRRRRWCCCPGRGAQWGCPPPAAAPCAPSAAAPAAGRRAAARRRRRCCRPRRCRRRARRGLRAAAGGAVRQTCPPPCCGTPRPCAPHHPCVSSTSNSQYGAQNTHCLCAGKRGKRPRAAATHRRWRPGASCRWSRPPP